MNIQVYVRLSSAQFVFVVEVARLTFANMGEEDYFGWFYKAYCTGIWVCWFVGYRSTILADSSTNPQESWHAKRYICKYMHTRLYVLSFRHNAFKKVLWWGGMRQKMDQILTTTLTNTFWCLAYTAPAAINAPLTAYMEEHIEAAYDIVQKKAFFLLRRAGKL